MSRRHENQSQLLSATKDDASARNDKEYSFRFEKKDELIKKPKIEKEPWFPSCPDRW